MKLRARALSVYAFLNNHYRGQAPANALQLVSRLSGKKVNVPGDLVEAYPALRNIARSVDESRGMLF